MLSTIGPDGFHKLNTQPERLREVNADVEALGVKILQQYALLGQWDFLNIIEAPDEGTMARVSLELGSRGTGRYETLAAIPIDDFISSL